MSPPLTGWSRTAACPLGTRWDSSKSWSTRTPLPTSSETTATVPPLLLSTRMPCSTGWNPRILSECDKFHTNINLIRNLVPQDMAQCMLTKHKKVSFLSFGHLIMMSFTQRHSSDQSHPKGSLPCNFKLLLTEDSRVHPGQLSPNWPWLCTIVSVVWVVCIIAKSKRNQDLKLWPEEVCSIKVYPYSPRKWHFACPLCKHNGFLYATTSPMMCLKAP